MSLSQCSSRGRKRGSTSTSKTKSTTNATTPKSKSTAPYHGNFQQNLIDSGIYPDEYEYPDGQVPSPPDNWEEINRRLTQPRPSLTPSQFPNEKFRAFKRANAYAFKERQIQKSVIPIIEGSIRETRCVAGGNPFTNLDPLTDGTLVPGNPDLYYGARPENLDREVRNKLSGHIVPSTQADLPIAPNFFLEAKGPDGVDAVASTQACYDNALGARGIQSLQSYGQVEPVCDNNAYSVASTYTAGTLTMYTTHPTRPTNPEDRPEYHTTQLRSFAMKDTAETFRQGATAFRNARDWIKEKWDEFIGAANERVANNHQAEASNTHASRFSPVSSTTREASMVSPTQPNSHVQSS